MKTRTTADIGFKCGACWALKQKPERLLAIAKKKAVVARVDDVEHLPTYALYDPTATDSQNFWPGFQGGVSFMAETEKIKNRRDAAAKKRSRSNSKN